jgi:pimeloyl-ACP methyl ester carboxylesterase
MKSRMQVGNTELPCTSPSPPSPTSEANAFPYRPDIKRLTEYWSSKYDWRKQEEEMNKLPQFMTKIEVDGFGELDIHFLHQRSSSKNAIPLLFVHGWPGNFLEGSRILSLLKEGEGKGGPAFDIVVPSLPNYCFSGSVKKVSFFLRKGNRWLIRHRLDSRSSNMQRRAINLCLR